MSWILLLLTLENSRAQTEGSHFIDNATKLGPPATALFKKQTSPFKFNDPIRLRLTASEYIGDEPLSRFFPNNLWNIINTEQCTFYVSI